MDQLVIMIWCYLSEESKKMQIPKTIKIDRNKRHYIEWHQSVTNDYFNTIYNMMEDGMLITVYRYACNYCCCIKLMMNLNYFIIFF